MADLSHPDEHEMSEAVNVVHQLYPLWECGAACILATFVAESDATGQSKNGLWNIYMHGTAGISVVYIIHNLSNYVVHSEALIHVRRKDTSDNFLSFLYQYPT
jgi:hypothetical protein